QRREHDEMPEIGETDSGMFSLATPIYLNWLPEYAFTSSRGPGSGERNFLPFLPWLAARAPVTTVQVGDSIEVRGVNTPEDLAFAESHLRRAGDRTRMPR